MLEAKLDRRTCPLPGHSGRCSFGPVRAEEATRFAVSEEHAS
jgi:hypothetical protein